VAIRTDEGVVMAGDRRATAGNLIAHNVDRNPQWGGSSAGVLRVAFPVESRRIRMRWQSRLRINSGSMTCAGTSGNGARTRTLPT
jgi:hypothetical protein